jgi:hypothetical protein
MRKMVRYVQRRRQAPAAQRNGDSVRLKTSDSHCRSGGSSRKTHLRNQPETQQSRLRRQRGRRPKLIAVAVTLLVSLLQLSSPAAAAPAESLVEETRNWYQGAFNREPDAGGWEFWITLILDRGCNSYIDDAAYAVMNSPEFHAVNDTPRKKVERMYRALFDRYPDAGGLNYWTGRLITGSVTFRQLFNHFYYSNEGAGRRAVACDLWVERDTRAAGSLAIAPYSYQLALYQLDSNNDFLYAILEGYEGQHNRDYRIPRTSTTTRSTNQSSWSKARYGEVISTSSSVYSGCQLISNTWFCDYRVFDQGMIDVSQGYDYGTIARGFLWGQVVTGSLTCASGIVAVSYGGPVTVPLVASFASSCMKPGWVS